MPNSTYYADLQDVLVISLDQLEVRQKILDSLIKKEKALRLEAKNSVKQSYKNFERKKNQQLVLKRAKETLLEADKCEKDVQRTHRILCFHRNRVSDAENELRKAVYLPSDSIGR
jgi:hypothetical protein